MNIRLDGKVILVTGGTRGIGKAITRALLNAGATVAVHGNSSVDAIAKEAGMSLHQADLQNRDAVIRLVGEVIETHSRLDVIINNAGIAIESSLTKSDDKWIEDWEKTLQVNLTALGILCREAIKHFQLQKGGIIINISSRAAFRGDTPDYLAYAASKGGVVALTRSIARGFGKQGITAFNVAPGFTRTDMAEQFIERYGEEYAAADIALEKMTEPEDIAPLIVFLSSGMAAHATGGTFDMNAGSYVH